MLAQRRPRVVSARWITLSILMMPIGMMAATLSASNGLSSSTSVFLIVAFTVTALIGTYLLSHSVVLFSIEEEQLERALNSVFGRQHWQVTRSLTEIVLPERDTALKITRNLFWGTLWVVPKKYGSRATMKIIVEGLVDVLKSDMKFYSRRLNVQHLAVHGFVLLILAMPIVLTMWLEARFDQDRFDHAMELLDQAGPGPRRFYALDSAAMAAVEVGNLGQARALAVELLILAAGQEQNFNYGNAIHNANVVLGRLALREGDVERAMDYLQEAGNTPGSPQLSSFGPNLQLAEELIDAKAYESVATYLLSLKSFWDPGEGLIDSWVTALERRKKPDFGRFSTK